MKHTERIQMPQERNLPWKRDGKLNQQLRIQLSLTKKEKSGENKKKNDRR